MPKCKDWMDWIVQFQQWRLVFDKSWDRVDSLKLVRIEAKEPAPLLVSLGLFRSELAPGRTMLKVYRRPPAFSIIQDWRSAEYFSKCRLLVFSFRSGRGSC